MTRADLETLFYDLVGTDSNDPAFPVARVRRFLGIWLDGLYADLKPDALAAAPVTLTVDTGQEHTYTLSTQAVPVLDYRKALEIRLTNDSGLQLYEKDISELMTLGGPQYALTGPDQSLVLTTGFAVRASEPIFFRYAAWPARLTDAGPTLLPERFQQLAAYGAAELAFARGGEGVFPATYARLLADGRAQLLAHMGRRSLDVTTRRSTDARPR